MKRPLGSVSALASKTFSEVKSSTCARVTGAPPRSRTTAAIWPGAGGKKEGRKLYVPASEATEPPTIAIHVLILFSHKSCLVSSAPITTSLSLISQYRGGELSLASNMPAPEPSFLGKPE